LDRRITAFIAKQGKIRILLGSLVLILLLTCYCGKAPSEMPEPALGSIIVSAAVDTISADSSVIYLDGNYLGLQALPFKIEHLEAGRHLLSVTMDDDSSPIDFSSKPEKVLVEKDKTSEIAFALTKSAPDFSLHSINDELINLSDFKNKAVLLIFFSYT